MYIYPKDYEVIVVGAGHAGVEAALAAARIGCSTLLLSMNLDTMAQMSCNPAIGGLAKGHLVREIDALGGEMGRAADMTGLQFRMLNTKKGPSVWAPRAQCDKKAYQFLLKGVCERQVNVDIKQAQVTGLVCQDQVVKGIDTQMGVRFLGRTVVITTGTFLRGLLHIGSSQLPGGRSGEHSAAGLSASLKEAGFELGRLKTGTPPRLLKRSIDFSRLQVQPGDFPVPYFTYWKDELFHVEHPPDGAEAGKYPPGSVLQQLDGQLNCHITSTTEKTATLIRSNLHLSPLYAGIIEGIGPRYCPSIEDKVVRFPDKPSHQIFLEPEGIRTDEIYVNGFSTSLPYEVQVQLVRTIQGCENAEIMRPAYAVEYDFVFPTQLLPTLETKRIRNLFMAGQINGTSGYEEAAAQGLMSGINAALRTRDMEGIVLRRDQAYIGVMIDDLVTKGTSEPYRMFTSRAEYRLLLRQDNADARLSRIGHDVGLLPPRRYQTVLQKQRMVQSELERIRTVRIGARTLEQVLRRPEVRYRDLEGVDPNLPESVVEQVEIEVKYRGYLERQEVEVERNRSLEGKGIPPEFDFEGVQGLRMEARQKLGTIRPTTVGQAARIPGITPADISLLLVWLKRRAVWTFDDRE